MPGQSDLKRAFAEDGALKTHVGGQALIEGVMMRGKFNWAAAVREPSGNIYIEEHDLASGKKKNGWLYWPVIRGCRAFVESLVLGYKALEIAALHAYAEVSSDDSPNAGEAPVNSSTTREMSTHSASEPESTSEKRAFSWKDDFGNPDEVIDALGAQRTLERGNVRRRQAFRNNLQIRRIDMLVARKSLSRKARKVLCRHLGRASRTQIIDNRFERFPVHGFAHPFKYASDGKAECDGVAERTVEDRERSHAGAFGRPAHSKLLKKAAV